MTIEKYYNKIVEVALDIGEKRVSKLQEHPRLQELYGMTGLRTKHFLNSLLSSGDLTYLELGVYRGASLTCGLYKNPEVKAYAVDNWHLSPIDHPQIKYELDAEGKPTNKTIPWPNVKLAALDNLAKFTPNKVTIIEKNFTDLKKSDIPNPVDITHLQPNPAVTKEQLISYLNTIYPLLQVTSVLIMEYHILDHVKEAVISWAEAKRLKIDSKFEKSSDSLSNTSAWYGGLGVYILTKQDITK
jgi:hypothetical protein